MSSATPRIDFSSAFRPLASRFFCCWRARTSTSPPAATPPTTIAATGRPQLRGSRIAAASQSASSATATSVRSERWRSSRSLSASGGSTGTSAERRSCSTRSLNGLLLEAFLQLLDCPVNQHLGGPFGAAERPRDLAVVHPEREPHDEGLATVVGELRHALQDLLHLLALLHELLGSVRLVQHARVVQLSDRTARTVAIEVRGQVVRDADQPGPERPPVRLALCAIEVPVGLKKGLLGQVLGVVVVAHPVVRVGVDVAQMSPVQLGEVAVETFLVGRGLHSSSQPTPGPTPRECGAARIARIERFRATAPAKSPRRARAGGPR